MRITNRTVWNTPDLRRVFALVLARWNKIDRPVNTKRLRINIVYTRWREMSGCAWVNTGYMTIRLQKSVQFKGAIPKTELNVKHVGYIFEHELAHCAGYHHDRMGPLAHWATADSGRYDYLDGLKIGLKSQRPPKEKPDVQSIRYKRALDALSRWETKLKRAETGVKNARLKVRYYERALAKRETND